MHAKINQCLSVCPLNGDCPLLGVSVNRGFTVQLYIYCDWWEDAKHRRSMYRIVTALVSTKSLECLRTKEAFIGSRAQPKTQ